MTSSTGGPDDNAAQAGHLIAYSPEIAVTLTSGRAATPGVSAPGRRQEDDHNLIAQTIGGGQVTHTLSSEGSDASEDGTGRGTPIVAIPIDMRNATRDSNAGESAGTGIGQPGDPMFTLSTAAVARPCVAVGFHATQDPISTDEQVPCIGGNSVGNGVMVTPLAIQGREGGAELEAGEPNAPANALRSAGGGSSLYPLVSISQDDTVVGVAENQQGETREGGGKPGQGYQAVREGTIVRRLTPLECERLQGYPDGWTDNGQADSARYRQLGNSVAVPCVEWIAHRLIAVAVRDG